MSHKHKKYPNAKSINVRLTFTYIRVHEISSFEYYIKIVFSENQNK